MSSTQAAAWNRIRNTAFRAPWLNAPRERELLGLAQSGDRHAMEELCLTHLRLVVDIAGRYRCSRLQAEDLVSEGSLGLVEAIRRFDLTQTTRLSAYAAWWIRARVREYVYKHSSIVSPPSTRGARFARAHLAQKERELAQELGRDPTRAELAEGLNLAEDEVVAVDVAHGKANISLTYTNGEDWDLRDHTGDPEELVASQEARWETANKVRCALEGLKERDRTIVREHFLGEGLTLDEIGSHFAISRQRVSQIVQRACHQLEHALSGLELEIA